MGLQRFHFPMNIHFFFGTSYFTKQLQTTDHKGFYLLRISGSYYFFRIAQGQLPQCNRRNTATVLRAVVKSHNDLQETKVFASGYSGKNLKNFSQFVGKSPCSGPFIVKLQPVIVYKRLLGQLYQKSDGYTETPTGERSVNFEEIYERDC